MNYKAKLKQLENLYRSNNPAVEVIYYEIGGLYYCFNPDEKEIFRKMIELVFENGNLPELKFNSTVEMKEHFSKLYDNYILSNGSKNLEEIEEIFV